MSTDDNVRMMTAPAPTPAYQEDNVAKLQRVNWFDDEMRQHGVTFNDVVINVFHCLSIFVAVEK